MKAAKYRNVGTKHQLIFDGGGTVTFEDIHILMWHVKKDNIRITNPEALPEFFREQLNK